MLPGDISAAFPYLNTVLDNTWYDHENRVLIGTGNNRRCAFRPHEIRVSVIADTSKASRIASEVVGLVNLIWQERDHIAPRFSRSKLPAVYDIFKLLPWTNCKQCGYPTCLAFAADLCSGVVLLEQCPSLSQVEWAGNREHIAALFSSD
jgi:ArsR family metal-binding transcriptional regulator